MELPSAKMEKNAGEQAFGGRSGVRFGTCYVCGIFLEWAVGSMSLDFRGVAQLELYI